jgi:predicted ATP-grasp superfamily ATP-dependent carboligase
LSYKKVFAILATQIMPNNISNNRNNPIDVLILDGESRQALVATRSFGRNSLKVAILGNYHKGVPAFASKWCYKKVATEYPEASKEYLNFLIQFLKENKVKVVIPCSDGTVELLRKNRSKISRYTCLALGSEKALQIVIDKNLSIKAAKQVGIKVPKTIIVSNESKLKKTLAKFTFPLVLKPEQSWTEGPKGSKRVAPVLVFSQKQAQIEFKKMTEFGGQVLVQEYLKGSREAISYVYGNKKFYAKFAQWAKRTQPPVGGTSVLRKSIDIPDDLGHLAEALIKKINLEGYSEVEFRRDEKGTPYFMEINPRLSASVEVAVKSGVDFPMALFQWASKQKVKPTLSYKSGIWERYLIGDLITTIQETKQPTSPNFNIKPTVNFLGTFLQPMAYDYLDLTDPLPALHASSKFIIKNVTKIVTLQSINL